METEERKIIEYYILEHKGKQIQYFATFAEASCHRDVLRKYFSNMSGLEIVKAKDVMTEHLFLHLLNLSADKI